ncbi:MAG: hypothetical protein JST61_04085 [Acidobacteria bacterium]|nr:hypothetical protein [Acidobacteriota bacterium]
MTRETFLAGMWMLGSVGAVNAATGIPTAAVDWNTILPAVQRVVHHTFPNESADAHYPAAVVLTADLSGTGGSEALINLGSGGYTDDVTVMQLQGENPVAAKFRGHDDKIGPMVFTSGNAEDRGGEVRLIAKDHAVFSGYWEMKGPKLKECHGDVYQWDDMAKNFAYVKKMSKEMGKEYCSAVAAKLKK